MDQLLEFAIRRLSGHLGHLNHRGDHGQAVRLVLRLVVAGVELRIEEVELQLAGKLNAGDRVLRAAHLVAPVVQADVTERVRVGQRTAVHLDRADQLVDRVQRIAGRLERAGIARMLRSGVRRGEDAVLVAATRFQGRAVLMMRQMMLGA